PLSSTFFRSSSSSHLAPLSPLCFFLLLCPPPISTLFPYTTLFRSPSTAIMAGLLLSPAAASQSISRATVCTAISGSIRIPARTRSEEHTSELQSRFDVVCRLLLEKKKKE